MRKIAFSLLLLFTAFTVVLSTYYLWQDNTVMTMMPIEEEEDHHVKCFGSKVFLSSGFNPEIETLFSIRKKEIIASTVENFYEDVFQNTPYSPPDLILCA